MPWCLGICFWPLKKMLTLPTGTENTYVSTKQLSSGNSVSTKSYQGTKIQAPNPATPAVVPQSHYNTLLRELRHPFSPHFLPPPGHGCCSLNFITDNRTAHRPMLHQPHHLPPYKKGMKCTTMKEGFSQISSLSYLPKKSYTGTTKDTTPWQIKVYLYLCCLALTLFLSNSFAFSHPSFC